MKGVAFCDHDPAPCSPSVCRTSHAELDRDRASVLLLDAPGGVPPPADPDRAAAGQQGVAMSFRVRVPRGQENQLEVVPMETALKLERHLDAVAFTAAEVRADPLGSPTLRFRFEVDGFMVEYRIDHPSESIVVTGLSRSTPNDPFCGCEI